MIFLFKIYFLAFFIQNYILNYYNYFFIIKLICLIFIETLLILNKILLV